MLLRSSFLKNLRSATVLKKSLWYRCFTVNSAKFLRTPFFYRTPPVSASEVAGNLKHECNANWRPS